MRGTPAYLNVNTWRDEIGLEREVEGKLRSLLVLEVLASLGLEACRVLGLGFGVWGLGFGVWGLGFAKAASRWASVGRDERRQRFCTSSCAWFRVLCFGLGSKESTGYGRRFGPGSGFRVEGLEFGV